ncbi:fibrinogen-like protein 1-like protein [Alligator sinensis]|uniref:Fibrinogen-like protein 1-like protein n=1 Tax=Alligator sinensis TaxID=38654 RepID=A0A3Q0G5Y5_ALLSI|nr:fibrinogen-like protein 1-like protein [Alligator sinensis]XP_025053523.1 fibrinogen-like protein 1-like protein [Alligator sinensis]XP_025053524.1 fibrinogen-like protein 1-like protein [Alligator sinensis]
MKLKSSLGFILLFLFKCDVLTSAEEAVVLANAHLLPQRGYEKLGNNNEKEYPRDCYEIFQRSERNSKDGLYVIQPMKDPIVVYCNMQDGGWTVIQHITANSTVDFDRTWQDYKCGFGSVHDNYWLGNEYMHQLTSSSRPYTLRVKLVDLNAEIKWGEYDPFYIENEESQYRIRVGLYKGNAMDALTQDTEAYLHDNQKFTTKDRDNDNYFQNCAKLEYNGIPGGGWWYDACAGANLNRRNVIYWQKDCNKDHMCKFAWMMVKPSDYGQCTTKACPCHKDEL